MTTSWLHIVRRTSRFLTSSAFPRRHLFRFSRIPRETHPQTIVITHPCSPVHPKDHAGTGCYSAYQNKTASCQYPNYLYVVLFTEVRAPLEAHPKTPTVCAAQTGQALQKRTTTTTRTNQPQPTDASQLRKKSPHKRTRPSETPHPESNMTTSPQRRVPQGNNPRQRFREDRPQSQPRPRIPTQQTFTPKTHARTWAPCMDRKEENRLHRSSPPQGLG